MKNLIPLTIITLIITSCSTNVFLQRKYTSGAYIESIAQKRKTEKRENIVNRNSHSKSLISGSFIVAKDKSTSHNKHIETSIINEKNNINNYFELSKTCHVSQKSSTKKIKSNIISTAISHDNNNDEYTPYFSYLPLWNKNLITKSKLNNNTKAPSDEERIIWILLALIPFINLIPIYLHDGKKVTINFVVCLILNFIFLLPGIIFALLVVLDVVNLA